MCERSWIYFKMVKDDVSCLEERKKLLMGPECYLYISNYECRFWGIYLYYDSNDQVWIQPCKVTGTQNKGTRFWFGPYLGGKKFYINLTKLI